MKIAVFALGMLHFGAYDGFAQRPHIKFEKLPNADFSTAIEIEDSVIGPANVSRGFGAFKELSGLKSLGEDGVTEHNSAWFKFTLPFDTILTFDIVPIDSLDDYDFALFKCPDGNCSGKNGMKNLIKLRHCFSVCSSKSGMTGMSKYASVTGIQAGLGPAYVCGMPVKAGETYYLMVDFAEEYIQYFGSRTPLGFKIYFYNHFPRKKPVTLNNVLFETNKSILKSESFSELDKLVVLLKKNPMVIEIRGHTDNVGDETKNRILSDERAKAVVDYLISKNINKTRLFYKGFGNSKPIADNKTEEGRTKNRRVEFVILLN